jgi:hypothetical protein
MNRKEYHKEYRLKNKDKIKEYYLKIKDKKNEYRKEWRLKNKDRINEQKRKHYSIYKDNIIARKYKITPEQLEVMYKEQDNCCKICNTHKDDTKMGLFIDHCHKTLEVRGLLCHHCNSMLGFCKDDTELLEKGKQYLKTNGKFN